MDSDPFRSLPKPQQRRIHRAVILGRPVSPHEAAIAAGHARHLRWYLWLGTIIIVVSATLLVATAFAPHTTWASWGTPAVYLVWGSIMVLFGFNARRAARAGYGPPG